MITLRRQPKTSALQRDIAEAVANYRAAVAKTSMVSDSDMIDAAAYELLAARTRLDYLIRISKQQLKGA